LALQTFEFCEDNLFHIENCNTVKNLGEGVKKVEMAVMLNKKLAFIEAKSSSPAPDNQDKFDEYMQRIYEEFRNSLLILPGIAFICKFNPIPIIHGLKYPRLSFPNVFQFRHL
jgi:hypothetical protein